MAKIYKFKEKTWNLREPDDRFLLTNGLIFFLVEDINSATNMAYQETSGFSSKEITEPVFLEFCSGSEEFSSGSLEDIGYFVQKGDREEWNLIRLRLGI